MWELAYKESWAPKNWCFWTVVLEKTLESPLDCKEIQPVNPKGNKSWIFIVRTGVEAEAPILWPPNVKIWLIGKDPDAGKDLRKEEKWKTQDEMFGWHQWLEGHGFEQAPGVGDRQGTYRAAVHWVVKSWTWLSDWTELIYICEVADISPRNLDSNLWFIQPVILHDLCLCMLSHFSRVQLCVTLWTAASQAPLSMWILQVRTLEGVAMPSSRGSYWPRNQTCIFYVPCIGNWVL